MRVQLIRSPADTERIGGAWLTSAFSDWLKASGGRINKLTDLQLSLQKRFIYLRV